MQQQKEKQSSIDQILTELRRSIINMAEHSGHVGVALSCVDIIAALYIDILKCTPDTINSPDRDRFILSKGHGCMALYSVLAYKGFINKQVLGTYCTNGSLLAEHPLPEKISGVECVTGSLGHGLSIGAGMAGGLKIQSIKAKVFVLMGDGECNEGSVWESAALARSQKLDNLIAIVDMNGIQACGSCSIVSSGINFSEIWSAHGWEVVEADGHNYRELVKVLETPCCSGVPRVLLCHTTLGKGIDFMENDLEWHYRPVRGSDRERALRFLNSA
jgi:transketolase